MLRDYARLHCRAAVVSARRLLRSRHVQGASLDWEANRRRKHGQHYDKSDAQTPNHC